MAAVEALTSLLSTGERMGIVKILVGCAEDGGYARE
jgi:hypothetical protein